MDDKNAAPRMEYYFLAIGIATLIAVYPSLSLVAIGVVLAWYAIRNTDEYRYLAIGFIVAFLARAAIALSIFSASYQTGNYYGFGPDGLTYSGNAWALLSVMRGTVGEWWFNTVTFPFPYSTLPYWTPEVLTGKLPYLHDYSVTLHTYLIMSLYWVFGFVPLTIKLLNCLFGASAALVQYFIARELFGQRIAKRTYPLLLFFPTIMIWSTTMLRDPLFYLIISLFFLATVRHRIIYAVGLFAVVWFLRKGMSAIIPAAVILALMWGGVVLFRNVIMEFGIDTPMYPYLIIFFVLLSSITITHVSGDFVKKLVGNQVIQAKLPGRGFRIYSNEAYEVPDFRYYQLTKLETAQGVMWGLVGFYVRPHPWKVKDWIDVAVIPQMILWGVMFPFAIFGIWYFLQGNPSFGSLVFVFSILLLAGVMMLTEGNEGTLVRHRDIVVPFYLMFAMGAILRR